MIDVNLQCPASSGNLIAAIYFSSNAIYYPNEEGEFRHSIFHNNRFEWFGTRYATASRHIFVRDVFKQWYVEGISETNNSADKVIIALKELTKGYNTITIGSSAGGYAAALIGCALDANEIFCFAAQFDISNEAALTELSRNPLLVQHREDPSCNKYFELKDIIKSKPGSIIHYFAPLLSAIDIPQIKYVEDIPNLNIYRFKTKRHGIPFLPTVLTKLLGEDKDRILKYLQDRHGQELGPTRFSILFSDPMKLMLFVLTKISGMIRHHFAR